MNFAACALAALAAFGASSCFSFNWKRATAEEQLPRGAFDALAPGDDLAQCLATLGAPLEVWEYRVDGLAIAYGWLDQDSKGFGITLPISRGAHASFNYDDSSRDVPGAVLFFDASWKLVSVRRGMLRDLLPHGRASSPPDES
jgi:hypothetical protein